MVNAAISDGYNGDENEDDVLTDADIEAISRKAANKAARESASQTRDIVVAENEHRYDDMTSDGDVDVHEKVNSMIEKLKKQEGLDIFEDVGSKLAEHYHFVKYQIKRDGEILTTKRHPYSWVELQQEFGGGSYQVTAKSESNVYIKTQTQRVAPPLAGKTSDIEPNKKEGMSAFEILALMDRKSKEASEDAEKRAARDRETLMTMLTAMKPSNTSNEKMMELMQSKSDDTLKLMIAFMGNMKQEPQKDNSLEMMKFMVDMQNQSQTRTENLIKALQDNTNRVLDQVVGLIATKKEEGPFDALKVFEMVESARNQGVQSYKEVTELAEYLAEQKTLLAGSDRSGEKESITDTIIRSMVPALGTLLASKQAGSQAPVPTIQSRRSVSPTQTRIASPQGNAGQRPNTQGANRAQSASQTNGQAPTNRQGGAHGGKTVAVNTSGLPSALDFLDGPQNSTKTAEIKAEVEAVNNSGTMINEHHKARIIESAVPVIVQCYTTGKRIDETVATTIQAFRDNQVDLSRVHIDFLLSDIEEIITGYGFDSDLGTLLREYYAELIKTISKLGKTA
jgi:hypothetical protein